MRPHDHARAWALTFLGVCINRTYTVYLTFSVNRVVPKMEVERVSGFLQSLLHCNIDSLPTQSLVHRYMFIMPEQSSALKPYVDCYRNKKYKWDVQRFISS